jgi:membrane-associated phospholipid phosphatase
MTRLTTTFATIAMLIAACRDSGTEPINACAAAQGRAADSAAAVQWNARTRALVTKYRTDPSARPYALVSVAQLSATTTVGRRTVQPCASARSAVATASAAILTYLYPDEAAALDAQIREQRAADATFGLVGLAEGDTIGRYAAAAVVAVARNDGADATFTGPVPTGAGYWFSSTKPPTPPTTPMLGTMRPWVLASGHQFRPVAPPVFDSPEFRQALAEVKAAVTNRTAEQLAIAQRWALSGGTFRTQGQWNLEAAQLLQTRHASEADAAHTFALLNVAMNDASIACFDAKYTYWFIRPSQADASIATAIGLPNHPSYPSSHSCTSGAGAEVLSALFPGERARLRALADEIGLSRLYAGIHYRFDIDAGLSLGERVARAALDADAKGLVTSLR